MLRKDLFLSSLVTVLVLCLSRCAPAQDVVMPDGKELPTEVMLDEDGRKMFCWVASEGELPLEEPNADSEPVFASNSFDWMKTMYVMAEHTTDEGDFVLVAQPRGNDRPPQVQGWVRKGVLIFGANHALRSTEGGKLFQKVRLSNTNISLLTRSKRIAWMCPGCRFIGAHQVNLTQSTTFSWQLCFLFTVKRTDLF